MGQALDAAEKLEEIKKKAAEEAIAKFKAQLPRKRGMLTATEVEAAAVPSKGSCCSES